MAAARKSRRKAPEALPDVPAVEGMVWGGTRPRASLRWLVPGLLPEGRFVLLEGKKGVGKSTLLATVAAAITGGGFLPGFMPGAPGTVAWGSCEEDFDADVCPRIDAAGGDHRRAGLLEIPRGGGTSTRLSLPTDRDRLHASLTASGARLLVLDSVVGAADGGLDLGRPQPAREYAQSIVDAVRGTRCLAVGVRHLGKARGQDVRDEGLGNVELGNVARHILRCAEHPHTRGLYCLSVVATNLGPRGRTLTYRIVGDPPAPGRIQWEGECNLTAEEISEGQASEAERDEWRDSERLLASLIGSSWVPYSTVESEALRAGVTPRMLRRCKARLGVVSRRVQQSGNAHWEWGPPDAGFSPEVLGGALGAPCKAPPGGGALQNPPKQQGKRKKRGG